MLLRIFKKIKMHGPVTLIKKHLHPKFGLVLVILSLCALGFGIYAGVEYTTDKYDQEYMLPSTCLVLNSAITKLRCGSKTTVTCFQATWQVRRTWKRSFNFQG